MDCLINIANILYLLSYLVCDREGVPMLIEY